MSDVEVALPTGNFTVSADWSHGNNGITVIVAHGAGAGKDHPFLVGFADALDGLGFSTLRFNFPYVEQGRRMPGPASHAIATWNAVAAHAREVDPEAAVWAAGKSYGGRMASMAAADGLTVDGLVYLGYPLHAPGKPEKPKMAHLPVIAAPQLFVEGANDPFIQPISQFEQAVATCQRAEVAWIDDANHTFEVKGHKRPADTIGASLAPIVSDFILRMSPRRAA
ncbi:alpha/beta family hydrolase [Microbacterium sp. NPDC076768]|uniref:alpha/beta hydrolase family protein n=1 Tax=Microbacterium sp. NPDC076768 TaxID=3154858 RepID=UPI00341BA169